MKNKAEAIKAAWIAEIGEEKYNEVKDKIREDGFMPLYKNKTPLPNHEEAYDEEVGWCVAPKGMSKIIRNNGWNRIDEVGLPSESMTCDFIINNSVYRGHYNKHVKQFHVIQDYFPTEDVTHYKEVKTVLPIY